MPTNSKNKGNRFERAICKFFKEWSGYEFSRVPQSGGLRWKKADNITSDVICTDDKHGRRFPFSIECKFHKEIKFEDILLDNKSKILEFWEQASGDAHRAKKIPLLIMRYNNMPSGDGFLVVDGDFYRKLVNDKAIALAWTRFTIVTETQSLVVIMLHNLKTIPYKEFYMVGRAFRKGVYEN